MIKFGLVCDVKCFSALSVAWCMTVKNLCAFLHIVFCCVQLQVNLNFEARLMHFTNTVFCNEHQFSQIVFL